MQDYIPWDVHNGLMSRAVDDFSAVLKGELLRFQRRIRKHVAEESINRGLSLDIGLSRDSTHSSRNYPVDSDLDHNASVSALSNEALAQIVEIDSNVTEQQETLRSLRQQISECDTFLRAHVSATTNRLHPRRDQKDTDARRQSNAQRKATLAAFRKASAAIAVRSSLGSTLEPVRAQTNDKPTQSLTPATAESYFSLEKREEIVRDLNDVGKGPCDAELLARLQVAAAGERQLFEDVIAAMSSIHDQDRIEIDNALARQKLRLQASEGHVAKLVASELQRLVASQRHSGAGDSAPAPREDDNSDTASTDSDVLDSRDIELTRMTDGSIRISVGLQSEFRSPASVDLPSVSLVLKEAKARELQIRDSLDAMTTILRSLERCNEAFESDFFCASCRSSFVDLYLLWPCGHQYCLECVYRNEQPTGGYYCDECQATTTEIPVPNVAVNDIASRMSFKRSGVHGLFDVINRFRKDTFTAESAEKGFTAGLHIGITL